MVGSWGIFCFMDYLCFCFIFENYAEFRHYHSQWGISGWMVGTIVLDYLFVIRVYYWFLNDLSGWKLLIHPQHMSHLNPNGNQASVLFQLVLNRWKIWVCSSSMRLGSSFAGKTHQKWFDDGPGGPMSITIHRYVYGISSKPCLMSPRIVKDTQMIKVGSKFQ